MGTARDHGDDLANMKAEEMTKASDDADALTEQKLVAMAKQQMPDPKPRSIGGPVAEAGRAWTQGTSGRAMLRDVLTALKEELAECRQDMRTETLPGIENALDSLVDATEQNTAMLKRVETAIMEMPGWGVKS